MKRALLILITLTVTALSLAGQGRVVERTWVSTDKDVYVAGESIWYSAFCIDVSTGRFSNISSIAYLELHSADGLAATSRAALSGGRGAGRMVLPNTLPTGNYRLIVYTAQNRDEVDYDYNGIASKTISVFNVFSADRVTDGVEVVTDEEYEGLGSAVKPGMATDRAFLELEVDSGRVTLANKTGEPVTFSLSVYHDDGFLSNDNPSIVDFIAGARQTGPRSFRGERLPDYEGEVIRGHVVGFSEAMIPQLIGKYAFISSPSDKSDVYSAPIREDGSLTFFTAGIYGDKECVCEIEGIDQSLNCHVELESPYANAGVAAPAPLRIARSLRTPLQARSAAMQIERRFEADTLFEFLPERVDALFGEDAVKYILDDYTRFPTMEEDFVEFINEIKSRKGADGKREIRVQLDESISGPAFPEGHSLMMLDGVPVFDHEKIMNYDPLLVETVQIYPHTCFIGNRIFEGVANFVTYKRNLPSFTFGSNVRVIDWQGVSRPMAFTGESLFHGDGYPDYRQTIYWHPLMSLEAGAGTVAECRLPDYKGRFVIVAEGITAGGEPFRASTSFELR